MNNCQSKYNLSKYPNKGQGNASFLDSQYYSTYGITQKKKKKLLEKSTYSKKGGGVIIVITITISDSESMP